MFSKGYSFLTRAVFPQRCLQCNVVLSVLEQSLCQFCLCSAPQIDSIAAQRTNVLSITLPTAKPTSFRSALYFTGPVEIYCYSLKYGGNYALGVVLGKYFLSPLINSCFPRRPIWLRIMTPMDFPSVRREAAMLPKSCTAPKKIPPTKIQMIAGIHPKVTAITGPTIGPAPAMEAK